MTVYPDTFTCDNLDENQVILTVTDISGNVSTCTATVTVEDPIPPTIQSISVTPDTLWLPNHKMVLITPTITASDNCQNSIELTSITMNEGDETNTYDPYYDSTLGDGNTHNDIQVDDDGTIYFIFEGREIGNRYRESVYHYLYRVGFLWQ